MKLIDKDALEALVREVYEYDLCHDDADEYMEGRTSAGHGALEKIRDAPTIDAIPVEWMKDKMQKPQTTCMNPFGFVLAEWLEEQGARM